MKGIARAVMVFAAGVAALCLAGHPRAALFGADADTHEGERVAIFDPRTGKVVLMEPIRKSDEAWRKQLTPEQFHVTRKKGTEPPFTGAYHNHHESGIYRCVCCGTALYTSKTKFDSGTGWPSVWEPVEPHNVRQETDSKFFMR